MNAMGNQSGRPERAGVQPKAASGGSGGGSNRLTPVDPMRLLRQYMWLLIASVVVGAFIGGVLTFVLARVAPEYRATSLIEVRGQVRDPRMPVISGSTGDEEELLTFMRTQAEIIMSEPTLNDALARREIREQTDWAKQFQTGGGFDINEAVKTLKDDLIVAPERGMALIGITMGTIRPEDAPLIANTVRTVYLEQVRRNNQLESTQLVESFTRQRQQIEQDIQRLERERRNVLEDKKLPSTESRFNEVTINYQKLAENSLQAEQALHQARSSAEQLQKQAQEGTIEFSQEDMAIIDQDPSIKGRDDRILSLREERRVAMERFGAGHRTVKDLELRIAEVESLKNQERQRLLRKLQDLKISQAQQQVVSVKSYYDEVKAKLEEASRQMQDLNRTLNEYKMLTDQLDRKYTEKVGMDDTINQMSLAITRPDAVRVQRVGQATIPQERSFPLYSQMVPGFAVLLLMLTAGLVFLKEALDQRIKGPSCCSLLPSSKLLGVIPSAKEDEQVKSDELSLVAAEKPASLLAESFRQLRTGLLHELERGGHRSVMLVGAQPDSGVTSVLANLGATAAMNGRKVLVVDANFRRPGLHRYLHLNGAPGLSDVLVDPATLEKAIQKTSVEGLDAMPVGESLAQAFELLEKPVLGQVLATLTQRYDLVLIDAPPMSIVGDSRVLANRVDATVLVVRAVQEKRGLVTRVMRQLSEMNAQFTGLVLNGVRASRGGYFRRNYKAFRDYQSDTAHLDASSNGSAKALARRAEGTHTGV